MADAKPDPLTSAVEAVTANRGRPLPVMYWPPVLDGLINDVSVEMAFRVLTEEAGLSYEEPAKHMDVLIHTVGGEPTAAYRIAQIIRDFTQEASFLVPQYAWSGGTLICLSADTILLGHHAVLSPIDITLSREDGPSDVFPEEISRSAAKTGLQTCSRRKYHAQPRRRAFRRVPGGSGIATGSGTRRDPQFHPGCGGRTHRSRAGVPKTGLEVQYHESRKRHAV